MNRAGAGRFRWLLHPQGFSAGGEAVLLPWKSGGWAPDLRCVRRIEIWRLGMIVVVYESRVYLFSKKYLKNDGRRSAVRQNLEHV
jgi:hypothetical protein